MSASQASQHLEALIEEANDDQGAVEIVSTKGALADVRASRAESTS